jgi:beta-lactamase class D
MRKGGGGLGWNSWLKPENLVSIINEFYQGYCELMSCELGKKRRREEEKLKEKGNRG